MSDSNTYRIFISYSHDSAQHKLSVLELANRLRQDGLDAQIDRYVPFPPEGWPRWMRTQIDVADSIIVVCSSTYRQRFEGTDAIHRGLGARWEGLIVTQSLYDEMGRNQKRFIPVLLPGSSPDDIPIELRAFTHYRLHEQYDDLYRILTDQPEVRPPALGQIRRLPVVSPGAAEDIAAEEGAPTPTPEAETEREPPFRRNNREALSILQRRWSERRLSIVAGAGISIAAGLPTWKDMLENLLAGYVSRTYLPLLGEEATRALGDGLKDQFQYLSPIVSAQFIQSRFSPSEFVEVVRESLYSGATADPAPPVLCRMIAKLTPGLHSVVTFNFDDLLERALTEEGVEFTSITKGHHLSNIQGLPVYHPHGFLPASESEATRIILAENEYHSQYLAQHSWSNIVVSRVLMESTCLFVGTSMTDPNLRRLVDAAFRENTLQQHFLITHLPTSPDPLAQGAMMEILEAAHQQMGISPIWVENFSEVPRILAGIANEGHVPTTASTARS